MSCHKSTHTDYREYNESLLHWVGTVVGTAYIHIDFCTPIFRCCTTDISTRYRAFQIVTKSGDFLSNSLIFLSNPTLEVDDKRSPCLLRYDKEWKLRIMEAQIYMGFLLLLLFEAMHAIVIETVEIAPITQIAIDRNRFRFRRCASTSFSRSMFCGSSATVIMLPDPSLNPSETDKTSQDASLVVCGARGSPVSPGRALYACLICSVVGAWKWTLLSGLLKFWACSLKYCAAYNLEGSITAL